MKQLSLAAGIVLVLILLAIADATLIEGWPKPAETEPGEEVAVTETPTGDQGGAMKGVKKLQGPDVDKLLQTLGFTVENAGSGDSLLAKTIPADDAIVQTRILLKDNDRAGLISWVSAPSVKIYFHSLKEALHSSFSPQLQDLVDEKQMREGKPTRDFLSFRDPVIDEERFVFVRVREQLYEFHIASGQDDVIFELLEALTN